MNGRILKTFTAMTEYSVSDPHAGIYAVQVFSSKGGQAQKIIKY